MIYESGFGTLQYIYFPVKLSSDLTTSFFDFKIDLIFIFLFFYVLIVLILSYFLDIKMKFTESWLLIFRIMVKEHNLNIKHLSYRYFFVFILIYHFLLTILLETNVNTSLVVTKKPRYLDSIDDIYNNDVNVSSN